MSKSAAKRGGSASAEIPPHDDSWKNPQWRSRVRRRLLDWFSKHAREMPWRADPTPYRVWVSEIMLQQTQVMRVLVFYPAWLKQFPNWETLAKASNADVIRAWSGLGYNRRALVLRDIARQVVVEGVPKSREDWMALKGIGPYTAAAVTVFSLGKRAFPIDTNIRRVLGRLFLGKLYPQPEDDDRIAEVGSKELMQTKQFQDVPQALFDLATSYCKKVPNCAACPLRDDCASAQAFISGRVETPKKMIRKAKEKIHRNKKYPDRIFRGRILKIVQRHRGIEITKLGGLIDTEFDTKLDLEWLNRMVERMIKDKFVKKDGKRLILDDKIAAFPRKF